MRAPWWFQWITLLAASSCCSGCSSQSASSGSTTTPSTQTAYYVDCSQASDGSGTQASPWNTLTDVNSHTFSAGNSILLKRGATCSGVMLAPAGNGASGSPILIDAYGTGSLPIISAGSSNQAAIKLSNQQYWEIADLEIVGGSTYGVYITGDQANSTLNHLYLTNLNVHGATGTSVARADSGEVFIASGGSSQTLNDVLINGVTAHDSKVSEGIYVSAGGAWTGAATQTLGSNVTVENSTAYNVYGDGILIMEITTGVIKNSVVHNSGQCPSCGSTPSGLWEWFCHSCTIQNNESYANQSWNSHDGGDFDIDYYNNDNIVQYNYGHDAQGYCIAVFGAESTTDTNSIARYNVCSNNAQTAANSYQGEMFFHTWDSGSLNGVQIYNNTFYWNPASPAPLLNTTGATFSGSNANFFKNNIVYSTTPAMIATHIRPGSGLQHLLAYLGNSAVDVERHRLLEPCRVPGCQHAGRAQSVSRPALEQPHQSLHRHSNPGLHPAIRFPCHRHGRQCLYWHHNLHHGLCRLLRQRTANRQHRLQHRRVPIVHLQSDAIKRNSRPPASPASDRS